MPLAYEKAAAESSSLGRLTTPRFQLITDSLTSGRWEEALSFLDEARWEHEWAHDGFLHAVARVKSVVLEDFGQAAVERIGREMPREGLRLFAEIWPTLDFRSAVRTAAAGWQWHMTKFRLVEDDDKVTFLLEPCGSGGRLINAGAYYRTRERPLSLIPRASGSTFGEPDFPVYCAHCSELTGFNLQHGVTGWLVEGWTKAHRHGACRQHAFKRLAAVPEEFFLRTGTPSRSAIEELFPDQPVPKRVFTDEELRELETPPIDRLERAIRAEDSAAALEIVEECRLGWGTMQHDSYRDWLSSWYDLVLRYHGEAALESTMRKSLWELFDPILRDTTGESGESLLRAWAVFWRSHTALVSLEEAGAGWRFELEPTRLVDEQVSHRWPGPWLQDFCAAVNAGAADVGLATRFGKLTIEAGHLWHDLLTGD